MHWYLAVNALTHFIAFVQVINNTNSHDTAGFVRASTQNLDDEQGSIFYLNSKFRIRFEGVFQQFFLCNIQLICVHFYKFRELCENAVLKYRI